MKKLTLVIKMARWWGGYREEREEFDSLWVARYMAKEAFNDGNVVSVDVIDNATGEVLYYKNEKEEYYAGQLV